MKILFRYSDGGKHLTKRKGMHDCMVRALALYEGITYAEAWTKLRKAGWKYASSKKSIMTKFEKLGYKETLVTSPKQKIPSTCVLYTDEHCCAMVNNTVLDIWDSRFCGTAMNLGYVNRNKILSYFVKTEETENCIIKHIEEDNAKDVLVSTPPLITHMKPKKEKIERDPLELSGVRKEGSNYKPRDTR